MAKAAKSPKEPVAAHDASHLDPDAATSHEAEPNRTEPTVADGPAPGRLRRILRLLARIPLPKTRRGIVLLAGAVLIAAVIATQSVNHVVEYTESQSFCTTCHTMTAEKKAIATSAHAEVECGTCHVDPSVAGFVSAKLAGTRELYALVTNTYPVPIPPIELGKLPAAQRTCLRCHTMEAISKTDGQSRLILRTTFAADESNTRKDIAVLLRPVRQGTPEVQGVHWHVANTITFTSSDEHFQTIDSVEYTDAGTGESKQFIAVGKVQESNSADRDIERLKATEENRTMDCRDCHNRVGHPVANASTEIDAAMALGKIDPTLPYIKKTALALIDAGYTTTEEGQEAVAGLGTFYAAQYPEVAAAKSGEIAAATSELQRIYTLVDTPEMGVGSHTYPDNLGHQNGNGCFRCHDGAHYQVVGGVVSKTAIKSTCDTCHTFPQLTRPTPQAPPIGEPGSAASTSPAPTSDAGTLARLDLANLVPVGIAPVSHNAALFVFNHGATLTSALPQATTCASCHQAEYCVNCHQAAGAIQVSHTTMLQKHAEVSREAGGTTSCAVCHQAAYCSQCHKGDTSILGPSNSRLDEPVTASG